MKIFPNVCEECGKPVAGILDAALIIAKLTPIDDADSEYEWEGSSEVLWDTATPVVCKFEDASELTEHMRKLLADSPDDAQVMRVCCEDCCHEWLAVVEGYSA